MATITASQLIWSKTAVGRKMTEIDSGVTIGNGEVCGINTDGEVVEFNATAAMIYYGIQQGAEVEGDGTSEQKSDIDSSECEVDHRGWTLSGTSYGNYMVPMYHTGSTVAPTFTRPTTYGQCSGYQGDELEFIQFSEAQRALLGIAGGDKRTHVLGIMPGANLATGDRYSVYNWGRKSIVKIGARVVSQLAPTDCSITLGIYKGTAIGTATLIGTVAISGTADLAPGAENAYTTAFTANDGEQITIVPATIGSAASAGSMAFFYEEVGKGGN